MESTAFRETASTEGVTLPPMSFRTPEGLHAVPLPFHQVERAAAVSALVRDIFPEGDEQLWQVMEAVYGVVADEMAGAGIAFTGVGLYDVGDRKVGHCSLTIAVMESGHPDPEVAALGIRELFARKPMHDVNWLDLPCGPAVSVITQRSIIIDGDYTKSGADTELATGQIQVYVPFPTGPYTAVFTMDTTAMDSWDDFSTLMVGIVRSVEFPPVDPGPNPGQESNSIAGS